MNTKQCCVGAIFISGQIQNPIVAWKGRITCVDLTDRGFKFRREHPYYDGETFVLDQGKLDESLWVPANGEPEPVATAEFWASRFPGQQFPDWTKLSTTPTQHENWETVSVTIAPQS